MTDLERIADAGTVGCGDLLGAALPRRTVELLLGEDRFKDRAMALAIGALGSLSDPDSRQAALLDLGREDFRRFWSTVGGVWNARSLTGIVSGEARRALAERFGADFYGTVLEGRHLAPAGDASSTDLDALIACIEGDGWACCAAWCREQPRPVSARLAVFADPGEPTTAHREHAPVIVDWLLDDRTA